MPGDEGVRQWRADRGRAGQRNCQMPNGSRPDAGNGKTECRKQHQALVIHRSDAAGPVPHSTGPRTPQNSPSAPAIHMRPWCQVGICPSSMARIDIAAPASSIAIADNAPPIPGGDATAPDGRQPSRSAMNSTIHEVIRTRAAAALAIVGVKRFQMVRRAKPQNTSAATADHANGIAHCWRPGAGVRRGSFHE